MAIGVVGFGCEDALAHLLNSVWPNIFETSPHVVNAFTEAVEGLRVGCGSVKVLQYALQVGFNNLFPNQFYSPGGAILAIFATSVYRYRGVLFPSC